MNYNFYEIILLVVLIISLIIKVHINILNKIIMFGMLIILLLININLNNLLEWQGIIKILCLIFGIIIINFGYNKTISSSQVLILCIILASSIMVSTSNLLALYLCLELQSLSIYILIAKEKENLSSIEASIKYFVLSSISTGLFLLGAALIFMNLGTCDHYLITNEGYHAEKLLITIALLFKLGASPFHFWIPDVYQGSDYRSLLTLAVLPKISIFGILILLFPNNKLIFMATILSFIIGSVGAINQSNLNRLLAYSGILGMGFSLFGLSSEITKGVEGGFIYLIIYLITFSVIVISSNYTSNKNPLIIGLSQFLFKPKILPITLIFCVLSMAGIPPLGGFLAKWIVISSMVSQGFILSSILAVVCAMVAGVYYLRLVKIIYFQHDKSFLIWKRILIPNKLNVDNSIVLGILSYFVVFILISPQLLSNISYLSVISIF